MLHSNKNTSNIIMGDRISNISNIRATRSNLPSNGSNIRTFRGLSASNASSKFMSKMNQFSYNFQSPKISSGKDRITSLTRPQLFSLRDINDKVTDSHSTNLPIQYKRLSDDEIKKMFNVTNNNKKFYLNIHIKNQKESSNKKEEKVNEPISTEIKTQYAKTEIDEEKKTTNINNNFDEKKINLVKTTIDCTNKKRNSDNKLLDYKEQKDIDPIKKERKIKTASPVNRDFLRTIHPYSLTTRNDKWKPEGYNHYEILVKNPVLLKKELLSNPITSRLPNISIKEIKEKSNNSDIFFTKEKHDGFQALASTYKDHQNSDIFLIKNDLTSLEKSGETYLFKPQKREVYNVSKPSNSEWHAKNSMPTLLNHTSINWSMTNPAAKSIAKTKAQIQIDCKEKDPAFNPIYRQKSLCEFIDLTRVGAPNPNKTYLQSLNKTQECFRRRTDLCGGFNDIHRMYKDLCDRPFVKPKLIS